MANKIDLEGRSAIVTGGARGIGLADMAVAIQRGTLHRANGEIALHIVDILQAMWESDGNAVVLSTTCKRPEQMKNTSNILMACN